ncbi:MFS transporter [Staphylococcus lugdunensis]|uniref:MFS transporter n=1 Tax=Staphylococcus lugdunensis TaxID=28035 RepID=UPI0032172565
MIQKRSNVRWYFAIAFFIIGVIAYMDRSNISYIAPQMMADLGMDKKQFGLLASFFSLGYALMQVPSGMLAEKFGPRKMITIALLWWSAFTIFTGMIKHHGLLYFVRFLFGVGEAPMYPSNAVFNSTWFSKTEKGRASSALLAGSYFGPVLAPIVTIAIVNAFNWEAVFYIFGAAGILIAILWGIIAKDLPEQHKMVNEAEKRFIMENRDIVQTSKSVAPWGQFFRRFSFYAIAGQYFVVQFIITLFLIWLPTYLTEQYHVAFKDMAISSLPWLIMFFLILSAGAISDKILSTGQSRFVSRGVIAIVGFIVFAVAIFFAVHTENLYVTIFWLSLGLGGMGISMGMSWAAANDIGRNFAGTLVSSLGWTMTFQLLIIPAVIAVILWFFVAPDKPLLKDESKTLK